jgi:tetratricopeptide (TPR) repeat protein
MTIVEVPVYRSLACTKVPAFVLVGSFIFFSSSLFAQSVPLDHAEILGRLALHYSPSYIAHLVKTRGVSFPSTADFLDRVRIAGGEGILVDRLASAAPVSTSASNQTDEQVYHLGKCAELIHAGAVDSAEDECRASIDENPKSPWPLLVTAKLLEIISLTEPYIEPRAAAYHSDESGDGEESNPKRVEAKSLAVRALSLAPNLTTAAQSMGIPTPSTGAPGGAGSARQADSDAEQLDGSEMQPWTSEFPFHAPDPESNNVIASSAPSPSEPVNIDPELRRRIDLEPDLASNHVSLANAYAMAHDMQSATSELQAAVRLEPDYPELHDQLAGFYLSQNDIENGLAELREAAKIQPYSNEQRISLASSLDSYGRTSEAVAELKAIIAIHPADLAPSNTLVSIDLSHNDRKAAIEVLRRFLKASSTKFSDEKTLVSVLYYEEKSLANMLRDDKQYDAADERYAYLLRFLPNDADLHNDYGVTLLAQKRIDDAIAQYKEAVRLNPQDSNAHHNLGLCLARKNDVDGAIAELRQTMEINPNEPHTQVFLGYALAQKGDLNGAMDQFQQAIKANSQNAEAHAGLGSMLDAVKDTFGAITELKLSLQLQPDSPMAENELAWIYVTAKDSKFRNPTEGLVLAQRAVKTSPEPIPAFIDTLAEALLVNGYPDEAVQTELQAIKLDPALQPRLAHFREAAGVGRSKSR